VPAAEPGEARAQGAGLKLSPVRGQVGERLRKQVGERVRRPAPVWSPAYIPFPLPYTQSWRQHFFLPEAV
jgi:hypothetical protein